MRFALTSLLLSLMCSLSTVTAPAHAAGAPADPVWRDRVVEGWTLHINQRLLDEEPEATRRAVELLTLQLQEIERVVPVAAVEQLRQVPLWFSPVYPGVQPRAEYHPGAGWLKDNGRDPAMAKGVEFTDIRDFERETRRMPNFTLHELAHAWHDRYLPDGFGNTALQGAYERAKAGGGYERVEQRFGDGRSAQVRAYAMTSPMEYFAESTEAFFSTNDFFPFNAEQLRQHDPEMYSLLQTLWDLPKAAPVAAPTPAQWQAWQHSGSLWILTTQQGVELPAEVRVEQFPLLVRLHRDLFNFSQASPDGADIRFASADGVPLSYQIEHWDAKLGSASIWVRIPEIRGAARQELRMYWGNPEAQSESDGTAVFNESNGYRGVWHMHKAVQDAVGAISSSDTGTSDVAGMIGRARHFDEGRGVSGGEQIDTLPMGSEEHSTEVWFRAERMNSTLIGWGNEAAQGKVVMQFRSPPHIRMDCYFSGGNVNGERRLATGEWTQVVHTYRRGEAKLYINGELDTENTDRGSPLNIKMPARLYMGGWYNNYDFQGDLDEVRVSSVVRSAEWVRLQYENQKSGQLLVGGPVQSGDQFSVNPRQLEIDENSTAMVTARAGGADKVVWLLRRDGDERVVAADQLSYQFAAGRVADALPATVIVRASYGAEVRTEEVTITIRNSVPEPVFKLTAPERWDGRSQIQIVPEVQNLAEMQAQGAGKLNTRWVLEDVATLSAEESGRLLLLRAQGSGRLRVTAELDNGGAVVRKSVVIDVQEPPREQEAWVPRPVAESEQPVDGQFIGREALGADGQWWGQLVHAGRLTEAADTVFVRVYADEKLYAEETAKPDVEGRYLLTARLKPGLIRYRSEFGSRQGGVETVLQQAANLVCGDVFLIIGQSNAVATDFGKENPFKPNEWVRTFGATSGDPNGARLKLWAPAEARSPGGRSEIGYWGMELGRRLVESEGMPICIINGAVGGTRIDQHQRNESHPTDVGSIYGRMLWRVQEAGLTHAVRAVIWHQGENDQGADGPTGGYGYETYRQYFVQLAAAWKRDYPNVQNYYAFQIWPKSCAMGVDGSDNQLREVQRTLPRLFSNLTVISTLGIKPPGGCHFPAAGYAKFAEYLQPIMQHHLYGAPRSQLGSPNLQRARFADANRDEVILEFDQPMRWDAELISEFYLNGKNEQVLSGAVNTAADGRQVILKLKPGTQADRITYLDSARWNPEKLLYGENGVAALTFCDVLIELP